ncbi:UDP-hydrolyzing UDP-N-acetyl-D-glucosamine 2-epimerase [Rhodopirellula rubra]|uniref:UDP-hydrolyzing UDP-N-acetyl-D-glucosamine 2-epimerase n=1 Tax=Aporhodopirellula rubra TaxID=980271 RepID=A0A7W5H6Y8_9BACT|nr:UDP-N-acetylglucosamine 2-epimerase [Aporhodopirellula rubra]MBB3207818.1 UDP-hydrolyzing UDP-N-acetyl-D-glucosamine 2-epimerase [Aporhodopirellula rubra]
MTDHASPHPVRIATVTVARSDFGIYLPVLRKIAASDWAQPLVVAGAAHLSNRHGHTADWIVSEGFSIDAEVPITDQTDNAVGVAIGCAEAIQGFAKAFDQLKPDAIMLLGDRFEMHAAAVAAVPFGIPIIHLHGGEITQGAIDESYRHSITKLSHVHFASTRAYADRIIQMGEDPRRVFVSGAPGLDHLADFAPWSIDQLATKLDLSLDQRPLSITFHPETLCDRDSLTQVRYLIDAISDLDVPMVISQPNADPGNQAILEQWTEFTNARPNRVRLVANLGTQGYFSLLHHAASMVGNSSSGIIEAASFSLPVVNIGERQQGRIHAENVVDVGFDSEAIKAAITKVSSPQFRSGLQTLQNPYGDGTASDHIVGTLRKLMQRPLSVRKPFFDLPATPHRPSSHPITKVA